MSEVLINHVTDINQNYGSAFCWLWPVYSQFAALDNSAYYTILLILMKKALTYQRSKPIRELTIRRQTSDFQLDCFLNARLRLIYYWRGQHPKLRHF